MQDMTSEMEESAPKRRRKDSVGEEISLIDILATLLRYRKLIIISTMSTAILTLLYVIGSLILPPEKSYLPNMYKPFANMIVNKQDTSGLSSMLTSSGLTSLAGLAGISSGGTDYGQLAVAIAKSNTILDALVSKFDLVSLNKIKKSPKAESRKVLLGKYVTVYDDKTGILSISYEDRDPVLARDLVNYAVELLDKRFTIIGGNRNITKRDQLEAKMAEVQEEMTKLENEMQAFQQKYGVITIESIAMEQISTVAQVRSEFMMKEMEIKTYGDVSKVKDPTLMRLQAERDNLSKLLGELEKGFSEFEKVLPSQRELPKLALEYGHLKRDLLIQEKIFELLTQQYEITKLQIQGTDPIIQVLETAEVPDKKSGPSRAIICIVVTGVSFIMSILAALIIDAIKKIKDDPLAMAKLMRLKNEK